MPKLKKVDITHNQIVELVRQLEFEEKISLIKAVIREKIRTYAVEFNNPEGV